MEEKVQLKYRLCRLCCTPFIEVYHLQIFIPSMDKRISLLMHFTRFIAGGSTNLKKIHELCYTIHGEVIDLLIAPPRSQLSAQLREMRHPRNILQIIVPYIRSCQVLTYLTLRWSQRCFFPIFINHLPRLITPYHGFQFLYCN